MNSKSIWTSKTIWINALAIIVMIVQNYTGYVVTPELQVMVLGVINLILRAVTKQPVAWSTDNAGTGQQ